MFRTVHNVETGEVETIELTVEEITQLKKEDAVREAKEAQIKETENALAASKAALLDKLGITAEEAALLLS